MAGTVHSFNFSFVGVIILLAVTVHANKFCLFFSANKHVAAASNVKCIACCAAFPRNANVRQAKDLHDV